MQFLDLDDDCLVALINCVRPENLVNLVLGCRRLYELAAARLITHRDYVAKYSVIGLNYIPWFLPGREIHPCVFGKPTLDLRHSIALLISIDDDPLIASYIRVVYSDARVGREAEDSVYHGRDQSKLSDSFQQTLTKLGIVKGAESKTYGKDLREQFETRLKGRNDVWALALVLMQCPNLSHLKIDECFCSITDLLSAILNAVESIVPFKVYPPSDAPLRKGILPALTSFAVGQDLDVTRSIQPWSRFCMSHASLKYARISGFSSKAIDRLGDQLEPATGIFHDRHNDEVGWPIPQDLWRDVCSSIVGHASLETIDLRDNSDFDHEELNVLLDELSTRPSSRLRLIRYGNGYDKIFAEGKLRDV